MHRKPTLNPWESRGMPHRSAARHPAVPSRPAYTPQNLHTALAAEEQRQVFALLSRLRQARLR